MRGRPKTKKSVAKRLVAKRSLLYHRQAARSHLRTHKRQRTGKLLALPQGLAKKLRPLIAGR